MSNFGRRTIQLRETTTRQPRLGLARLLCFLAKHNQPLEQKQCGNMINTGIQKYGTNSILILIIYSKLSMNVIKLFALHVLLLPPPKKSIGSKLRGCDTFLLYFHSENANKHGTLEQVDYSWIEMIWSGSQALPLMTSRWAPLHSSTRLRHDNACTVYISRKRRTSICQCGQYHQAYESLLRKLNLEQSFLKLSIISTYIICTSFMELLVFWNCSKKKMEQNVALTCPVTHTCTAYACSFLPFAWSHVLFLDI